MTPTREDTNRRRWLFGRFYDIVNILLSERRVCLSARFRWEVGEWLALNGARWRNSVWRLGCSSSPACFASSDRAAPPLPSAVFFLLTNLIYIGLAMAWGFSISHRILHRGVRRYLMLGCAMAVLWLFLRAVKYRFFEAGEINRYLWYLYYVPQVLAPLFSLFAALQMGRREDEAFPGWWHLMYLPAALLIGGVLTNNLHHQAFRPALGAETLEAAYIHG